MRHSLSLLALLSLLCLQVSSRMGPVLSEAATMPKLDGDEVLDDDYLDVAGSEEQGEEMSKKLDDGHLEESLRDRMQEPDVEHMVLDHIPNAIEESTTEVLNEIGLNFVRIVEHLKVLDKVVTKHHRFLKKELNVVMDKSHVQERKIAIAIEDLRNDLGPRVLDTEDELKMSLSSSSTTRAEKESEVHLLIDDRVDDWQFPVVLLFLVLVAVGIFFYFFHLHLTALQMRRYRHLRRK